MNVRSCRKLLWIYFSLVLLAFAPRSRGQAYQITDLGTLPGQGDSSAVAINQSGQIAGNSGNRAFLYSNGVLTDLGYIPPSDPLAAPLTGASAINNKGQIVGYYRPQQNRFYGFFWDKGVISDPFNSQAILGGVYLPFALFPEAINDSGQVVLDISSYIFSNPVIQDSVLWQGPSSPLTDVGTRALAINNQTQVTVLEGTGYPSGEIWSPIGTTTLPNMPGGGPGGAGPTPYAINNSGQVAGEGTTYGYAASHAFLYTGGAISDLGTLGGSNSTARALNNTGQIVGDSELVNGSPNRHAFVYSGGQMIDLNTLLVNPELWELQTAVGINDLGQVVGTGTYAGATHAFLLTHLSSSSIYPTHGGNAGKVTVEILSPGFLPSGIQLVGGSTITGSAISPPSFLPTAVQVTFDLTGAQPGVYNLVLSQGASQAVTLKNVFTVDPGGAPDIRISVAGFPQLRAGLQQSYYLVTENLGTVDSGTIRVWVSFPDYLQWQPAGVQPSSSGDMNGTSYIAFDVSPRLGGNIPIPFTLHAPTSSDFAHRPFQIQAWEGIR